MLRIRHDSCFFCGQLIPSPKKLLWLFPPHHSEKAATFIYISVHISSVASHEGSLIYEFILGLLSAIFLQF